MSIEDTKLFYEQTASSDLCQCSYCRNYMKEIKKTYPFVAEYLEKLGINVEKPFETMPLEPDENGYIEYVAQYIVMGDSGDFHKTVISDVTIDFAQSSPSTTVNEPHFVIELYPVILKWKEQGESSPKRLKGKL